MADSRAAPRATAPVQSSVHFWPCSTPLQPLLPLTFPAPPLLVIFCAHLTFHHSLSCPVSCFPPRFPNAFLTALCPFWHICCLDTGFECLPLLRLPFWKYRSNRLILYFPKCPKALQSNNFFTYYCTSPTVIIGTLNKSTYPSLCKLYSRDLGTFRVALLFCYPERCWNHVTVISSAGTRHLGHALRQLPATQDVYPCPTLRNIGN
jgi:hypothetical protein